MMLNKNLIMKNRFEMSEMNAKDVYVDPTLEEDVEDW